jgi:hypothetical protein
LFPRQKIEVVSARIRQPFYVKEFALDHNVHPSIVYANYAHLYSTDEKRLWGQLDTLIRPPIDKLIRKLSGGLSHTSTAEEFANYYLNNIFNIKKHG